MHGASDFVSSGPEHKAVTDLVNQYNPGNATYMEIAKSDHWQFMTENELASYTGQRTGINPAFLRNVAEVAEGEFLKHAK